MFPRLSCVVAVGFLASAFTPPCLAADNGPRRVVIVESAASSLGKRVKEQLHRAMGEVIERHGLLLVSARDVPDKLLGGEFPAGLASVASATGAGLVFRVDASYASESFKLAVELWEADTGELLGRDGRDCAICDEQDFWGTSALIAQRLLDRMKATGGSAKAPETVSASTAAPPSTAAPNPPASGAPAPGLDTGTTATTSEGVPVSEYVGYGLILAGAVGVATGIYYIHVDGEMACSQCDWVRDTRKLGLPMTIAGGVALAGGLGLVIWNHWPSRTALALTPSGVFFSGRFQ